MNRQKSWLSGGNLGEDTGSHSNRRPVNNSQNCLSIFTIIGNCRNDIILT